jgi:hypothetical protein
MSIWLLYKMWWPTVLFLLSCQMVGREHPWSSHSLMHGIWFSYRGPYKSMKDKNTLKTSSNWSAWCWGVKHAGNLLLGGCSVTFVTNCFQVQILSYEGLRMIKQGGDLNVIWRELLNSRRNEISMKVYVCVCVCVCVWLPCFDVLCCVPDYWEGRL